YGQQIRKNATKLAETLLAEGLTLVGGGTETHLMVIDLSSIGPGLGLQAAFALDVAGIYANRNTVPHEPSSPFYPSGIRLGTPLVTTRGMKEPEMVQIGKWIAQVVRLTTDRPLPDDKKERRQFVKAFKAWAVSDPELLKINAEVKTLASEFPLFTWS
ncbi:hypothetical protein KC921_00540, partial [Candidatus Woesebacteria bacterium]|nr:hypothetical protein [Candidatus Woesebacteria bacterium]